MTWPPRGAGYLVDFTEATLAKQALEQVALAQQGAALVAAPLLLLQPPQLPARRQVDIELMSSTMIAHTKILMAVSNPLAPSCNEIAA